MYGLMILYVRTHDLLKDWRTTGKFVGIKCVVFLSQFQELILGWVISRVEPIQCIDHLHDGLLAGKHTGGAPGKRLGYVPIIARVRARRTPRQPGLPGL